MVVVQVYQMGVDMNGWSDPRLQGLDTAVRPIDEWDASDKSIHYIDSSAEDKAVLEERIKKHEAEVSATYHAAKRKSLKDIQSVELQSPVEDEAYYKGFRGSPLQSLGSDIKVTSTSTLSQSIKPTYTNWDFGTILEEILHRELDIESLYIQALSVSHGSIVEFITTQITEKSKTRVQVATALARWKQYEAQQLEQGLK